MLEPPAVLDSSQVLMYAILDASVAYTGRAFVLVDGHVIDPVPRLVITRNLGDDDILLLRCDENWTVLGAGGFASVEEAQRSAETAYSGIASKWQQFRDLNADEIASVAEIRDFLRDT